jgi:hypothetical protein
VEHGQGQVPVSSGAAGNVAPVGASESDSRPMSNAGSLPKNGSSPGLLRKHHSLVTDKKELDIMVVEFSSHDSTVGSIIGRNCKDMRWKVMFDRDADPIDIKLHVQEHNLHSNEVEIECDGQSIFHGAGTHAKAKMIEDFRYQWSFRGAIQGINELYFFEVNPPHFSTSSPTWFPATITGQRDDGYFEVTAQETDGNGWVREVKYPAVQKANLREAASQKPLVVPENCLTLEVPKQNPLHAVLSLDNGELVTHYFGRASPAPALPKKTSEIALKVSKDRSSLTANAGHQLISHFLAKEARAKTSEVERHKHSWVIQAGPFAEHKIEIAKLHTIGKCITLRVDGQVLVEGTADVISATSQQWQNSPGRGGSAGTPWQCKFKLIGERVLDFEVYKTNTNGGVLDETGHVKDRRKYVHECYVHIPNESDFSSARLFVDGTAFQELPMEVQKYEEANLTMTPMAMMHSYGITTPYMVDRNAPSNVTLLASQASKIAGDWFSACCSASSVVDTDLKTGPPITKSK